VAKTVEYYGIDNLRRFIDAGWKEVTVEPSRGLYHYPHFVVKWDHESQAPVWPEGIVNPLTAALEVLDGEIAKAKKEVDELSKTSTATREPRSRN
jgi:hypothetical protein